MFGTYYVNLEYVNPPGSYGWYLTILFFTLEYIVLLILMYYVLGPKDGIIAAMKKNYPFVIRKEG